MNCPRCQAHVIDRVVHVEDSPFGLYVVTEELVDDSVFACLCGANIIVNSTRPNVRTDYNRGTAHMSGAGDALVAHPGSVSGPIPIKEGHCA